MPAASFPGCTGMGATMNWADERYVRLYTRETAEWLAMCWEAKALFGLLLRKADRTGMVAVKLGPNRARLVGGLTGLPVEVAHAGLSDMLADGCLVETDTGYLFRNFIEAQEAEASDAKRAREYRERIRDKELAGITERDDSSRLPSRIVTERSPAFENVTPSLAVPSVPSRAVKEEEGPRRTAQNSTAPPALQLQVACATPAPDTPESLQELWNDTADVSLPRWREMPKERREAARKALKARPLRDAPNSWLAVFQAMSATPFCLGMNDRGWKANPDWAIKPKSAAKVLEGAYANGPAPPRNLRKGMTRAEDFDHSKQEADANGIIHLQI